VSDERLESLRARGSGRPRIERAWIVITVVLVGAIGLAVLGAIQVPERRDDMWFEVVDGALQAIVLALSGGVVAAVLRDRDAAREETRRREAAAAAFLEQVEETYRQVKSARRMLRTHGFASADQGALTGEQVQGFVTQMALLNEAELDFETHARRVATIPGPYLRARDPLVHQLTEVQEYLKGVLREWQLDPAAVATGRDPLSIRGWPRFQRFVGYDDEATADFRTGVADRMVIIEALIGGPDRPTG
jgi:hypothetical protein